MTLKHRPYFKQVALHVPAAQEYGQQYRLLQAGREQYAPTYPVFSHRVMEVHHLVYVEQGHGWLRTGGYHGPLSPGTVALLCSGTTNDMGPHQDDPMEITWLVLQGDEFPRLAASAGLTESQPCLALGEAPEPRAVFRELRRRKPGAIWRAHSLVWGLLARIAAATGSVGLGDPPAARNRPFLPEDLPGRPVKPPAVPGRDSWSRDDPAVSRAIDLARLHLREPGVRLAHLARAAALGRSRFAQRFRQATGVSPMRYLEAVRMEEARRLLEDEDHAVARVAQLAGFEDPLYFSRRFRALHGVAPSAYRAVARGGRA